MSPSPPTWAKIKEICTPIELERLACAFLNSKGEFDHLTAGAQMGIKPESFKRGIWVIRKKLEEGGIEQQLLQQGATNGGGKTAGGKRAGVVAVVSDSGQNGKGTPFATNERGRKKARTANGGRGVKRARVEDGDEDADRDGDGDDHMEDTNAGATKHGNDNNAIHVKTENTDSNEHFDKSDFDFY